MTANDAKFLASARERLEAERERLTRLHEGVSEEPTGSLAQGADSEELTVIDQHPADVGSEVFERQKDISIAQQFETELEEIEAALARIEDGSYGTCEVCGKPVGTERLEAIPQARFCIDDQAAADRERV